MLWPIAIALMCVGCSGCDNSGGNGKSVNPKTAQPPPVQLMAAAPVFNADSAYHHIQKQVSFGPRVPNTPSHIACAEWLHDVLNKYADEVVIQHADLLAFDGTILKSRNIIGIFNPAATQRILLCAHWDTRPFADQDDQDQQKPIDGANDGASGVGVLLEIARLLDQNPVSIGVDIILFDSEDYGQPDNVRPYKPDTYCLGSQYWSKNPHKQGYWADFGILLDMVGARGSTFTREGTSMYFAGSTMTKVWDVATKLGYSQYFLYDQTAQVTDDHLYINKIKGIPTIDIIHRTNRTKTGFGAYWHTHKDGMEIIDKEVLKAVGQTVVQVLYNYNEKKQIL